MSGLDRQVVVAGAISGIFFALPAAILQRTVFADTGWGGLMLAIVLFAGALAGYGAGRAAASHLMVNGAAAGVVTFVAAEIVYVVAARTVPNPIALVFGLLLFASLGTIGGFVAAWRRANDIGR